MVLVNDTRHYYHGNTKCDGIPPVALVLSRHICMLLYYVTYVLFDNVTHILLHVMQAMMCGCMLTHPCYCGRCSCKKRLLSSTLGQTGCVDVVEADHQGKASSQACTSALNWMSAEPLTQNAHMGFNTNTHLCPYDAHVRRPACVCCLWWAVQV